MRRILITGGAGFIGSNLTKKLVNKGYEVTILDNLSRQIHGDNPKETSPLYQSVINIARVIEGSVISRRDWLNAIGNQDAIIHLAAETGTGQSMYEIKKYVDVNIGGTALMLDILTNEKHSIKKIVVASSRAIYGEGRYYCDIHGYVYPLARVQNEMDLGDFECKCPICHSSVTLKSTDEDSKIHPTSVYGITKATQEQMVLTVGKSIDIPAVAFRYQNVYGPGQSLSNPYTGILSVFSTQIKNGNSINIFEDGKESRDFIYINDVVDATILGLEKNTANGCAFNVGADEPVSVIEVAKTLLQNYNSDVKLNVTGNYRLGDIRHNYADLTKIKRLLDFDPKWPFEKGIKAFTSWVEEQKIQIDNYKRSIDELKQKGLFK
ncbi:NAD-dependent epimerase/dehydratase family protein [Saccharicrinis sp. FJH2]|uniref:NAD-dependent epimerase/dehydratase family protein n=1 Tax=Saccharicrinis sp. FJH65 TaxID=3344659 RepID=UPI0035F2FE93